MKKRLCRVLSVWAALLMAAICLALPASAAEGESARQTVRVAVTKYPGYCYQDTNGVWCGVDVEYIENVAQHAGFRVEFVPIASTEETFREMDSGTVDIAADVSKNAEREQKYLFSEYQQGSASLGVVVRQNDDRWDYGNIAQLAKMKIGGERGNNILSEFRQWCREHDFQPNITEYTSIDDVMKALDSGETDASLIGMDYWKGYRTVLSAVQTPYYFVFRKDAVSLKNQVDTAMGEILSKNPLYEKTLLDKYDISSESKNAALSAGEKTYISSHPSVTVAVLRNDEPYCSLKEDGTPKGIIPDLYEKISSGTGVKFRYAVYDTQKQAVAAVVSGSADVLGMYSDGITYASRDGLDLTIDYTTVDTVMISHADTDSQNVRTIAVKERSRAAVSQTVQENFSARVVGYDTASDCFRAMLSNRADAVIIGLPSATWLVNQTNSTSYRITPLSTVSLELCGAVASGNSTLRSLMDKGIYSARYGIDGIVANNTLAENTIRTTISRIPPTLLVAVAAILLTLLIGLIFLFSALRKRQKEKVAVLAQAAATEQEKIRIEAVAKSAEEKNAFFSNISHDMRTPLNAVIGFIRMAKKTDISPESRNDYLDKAESSGRLLLSLIDDTLTMSKANSGKLVLHREPVSTEALGETITTPIRTIAAQKRIELVMDKSGYRPRVILADQLTLQKVFLNLLNNAVKYTPPGGHIWVTVNDEPAGAAEPETVFTIRDDGIGMSEKFLPHIFEPFTQEKRHGYESVGTGLGLSIVKKLVDLMHGTIEVKSEQNVGTVFTVRLRFREAAGDCLPVRQKKPGRAGGLSGKKILLCEDNALNREVAFALLEDRGMTVEAAEDGKAGIGLFSASAPDEFSAVLMDIRMPVMGGYEAARQIRALDRPDAKTIPIIAMTADAFEDDVQRCLEAGMNEHLSKPIEPELLYASLSRLICGET